MNDDGTSQTTDQDSDVKQKGGVEPGVIAEQFARSRGDFSQYQGKRYIKALMSAMMGGS
jgi:hypothetical protein